jgi:hypothetical protein
MPPPTLNPDQAVERAVSAVARFERLVADVEKRHKALLERTVTDAEDRKMSSILSKIAALFARKK